MYGFGNFDLILGKYTEYPRILSIEALAIGGGKKIIICTLIYSLNYSQALWLELKEVGKKKKESQKTKGGWSQLQYWGTDIITDPGPSCSLCEPFRGLSMGRREEEEEQEEEGRKVAKELE